MEDCGVPSFFEPLNPRERQRVAGVPVGIQNVGNTCYFNSLLQSYFMVPKFAIEVLSFVVDGSHLMEEGTGTQLMRKRACITLVEALQRLFGLMIRSHKKYVDPSKVLTALVDSEGNPIQIGQQQDVGEFNIALLECIDEGLKTRHQENSGDSVVSSLFYGQVASMLTYTENGESRTLESHERFGQILLDVEKKDLYSAWDSAYSSTIEGYATSSGHTTATQEFWADKLPELLLFQVQRVKYNQESYKIHSAFHFPLELHPGRFMAKHRQTSLALRSRMLELKAKLQTLDEHIARFTQYSILSLDHLLTAVHDFVDKLGSEEQPANTQDLELFTPEAIQYPHSEAVQVSKQLLVATAEAARTKLASMKNQRDSIQAQLDALFDLPDLKEEVYNLHSILIHDGQAGSGHYYAYIYDPQQAVWRKYNDRQVSVVEQEQVLKEAYGGHGLCSAYCLVYSKPELPINSDTPLRSFALVDSSEDLPDLYSTYLPEAILKEVHEDNLQFRRELETFAANEFIEQVKALYNKRVTICESYMSSTDSSLKKELVNFPIYLCLTRRERLAFWSLLDISVKDTSPEGKRIEEFSLEFKTQLQGTAKNWPRLVQPTPEELTSLDLHVQQFRKALHEAVLDLFVMDQLLEASFDLAGHGIMLQLSEGSEPTEFGAHTRDLMGVYLLRLTSEMVYKIHTQQPDEALKLNSYLIMLALLFLAPGERIQDILHSRFNTIKDLLRAKEYTQCLAQFEEQLTRMQNQDFDFVIDLETPPDKIKTLQETLIPTDVYSWVEGWNSQALPKQYGEIKATFEHGYAAWIAIYQDVLRGFPVASKFDSAEAAAGLNPAIH